MKRLALIAIVLLSLPLSAQTFDCAGSGGTNCAAVIPDPGLVTSTITLPAACGAVNQYPAGFTVDVDLTHTFVGDLTLTLMHPNGVATSTLVQRPLAGAGTCGSDDILGTFSDAGAAFQCAPTIPANGVSPILPVTPLSAFANLPTAGVWSLAVDDASASGAGALNNWGITAICGTPPTVTIAASDPAGNEAGDTITFVITRSAIANSPVDPSLPLPVTVLFSGTALEGIDYVASIPVVIPAGEASTVLVITPLADALIETPETVIATVQPSAGYVVGVPAEATGVIEEEAVLTAVPTLSTWSLLLVSMLLAGAALFVLRGGSAS